MDSSPGEFLKKETYKRVVAKCISKDAFQNSKGFARPKGYSRKIEGSSLPALWIPCLSFGCTGTILG